MPTNFPTGTDNFGTPNNPGSTALSSAGSSSRNHVQSHKDLGDAIVAMEQQASMAAHTHDGATARYGNKLPQSSTHQSPDTDVASTSIHHTLGHLANQAAPGNHASLPAFQDTHAATVTWPVGSIFIAAVSTNPNTLLGIGTWSQIQDAFLVGVGGSYSYTGSVVTNTTTHGHSVSTPGATSEGTHTHSIASPTDTQGSHYHTMGSTGSSSVGHTHGGTGSGIQDGSTGVGVDDSFASSEFEGTTGHSHSFGGGASSTSHSHTMPNTGTDPGHSHTVSAPTNSSDGVHTHSPSTDTPAHLPPWQAFYVWKRTA